MGYRLLRWKCYNNKQYFYYKHNPPGLRANGVSGSFLDGPMVKGILLSIDPGDPSGPETWRRRILGGTFSIR